MPAINVVKELGASIAATMMQIGISDFTRESLGDALKTLRACTNNNLLRTLFHQSDELVELLTVMRSALTGIRVESHYEKGLDSLVADLVELGGIKEREGWLCEEHAKEAMVLLEKARLIITGRATPRKNEVTRKGANKQKNN